MGHAWDGDEDAFTDIERDTLRFVRGRMYKHKVLRVNYTTYDMRRDQDSINPRTHPDIMLHAHENDVTDEDPHPFWYARVIGIYHVDVLHTCTPGAQPVPQRMDFLWVRWFGRDLTEETGFQAQRLHHIGFIDSSEDGAFGFLDPKEVIRAVHLIQDEEYGQTEDLLPQSLVRQPSTSKSDWMYYHVNM